MSRTVYVNGEFLAEEAAKISVFDRGFLFADGVYEVSSVIGGKLIDNAAHLARLARSCKALSIDLPASGDEITAIQKELIAKNSLTEGVVYLQVTRGAADRDFPFPKAAKPSLVMFTQVKSLVASKAAETGIRVITTPDLRWGRCDIKTVQLLGAVLAKQAAADAGVDDAWFVDADGNVTEGSSNNAYIVKDGRIITRALSTALLPGITRASVVTLAAETGMTIEERPFTVDEAQGADEAFITSATTFVTPVIRIDSAKVGAGAPGPVARRLREIYINHAIETAV
ncbi:D-amino-acid transaminase [Pseudokordiimonas caeni]|uniref:D-amino-acid transaminase n=1 Tax=Pseudokordiimonas caeni TaxID=2997908 RepID=UPI0028119CE1|nr:D-amino-acid transaminase [Pseudokordiimonas caeni]